MSKPRKVFYGIVLSGLFCVWGLPALGLEAYAFPLLFLWMVASNLVAYSLRCRHCQKQLIKTKDSVFIRGWGWGKCDFCGEER